MCCLLIDTPSDVQTSEIELKAYQEKVPARLEDTDPELAEIIRKIANHQHPVIRGFSVSDQGIQVRLTTGLSRIKAPERVERYAPCPCGSGKKYKHCCLTRG